MCRKKIVSEMFGWLWKVQSKHDSVAIYHPGVGKVKNKAKTWRGGGVVSVGLFLSQIVCFCTMEYQVVLKLSICPVIISQKGSNGDGKLHFFGWDYVLLTLFAQKYQFLPNFVYVILLLTISNFYGVTSMPCPSQSINTFFVKALYTQCQKQVIIILQFNLF